MTDIHDIIRSFFISHNNLHFNQHMSLWYFGGGGSVIFKLKFSVKGQFHKAASSDSIQLVMYSPYFWSHRGWELSQGQSWVRDSESVNTAVSS